MHTTVLRWYEAYLPSHSWGSQAQDDPMLGHRASKWIFQLQILSSLYDTQLSGLKLIYVRQNNNPLKWPQCKRIICIMTYPKWSGFSFQEARFCRFLLLWSRGSSQPPPHSCHFPEHEGQQGPPYGLFTGWVAHPFLKGAETVRGLLEVAKDSIPRSHWKRTPVVLKATAGLRLLPEEKAQALLLEVSFGNHLHLG